MELRHARDRKDENASFDAVLQEPGGGPASPRQPLRNRRIGKPTLELQKVPITPKHQPPVDVHRVQQVTGDRTMPELAGALQVAFKLQGLG
jgi:hypothetical protein